MAGIQRKTRGTIGGAVLIVAVLCVGTAIGADRFDCTVNQPASAFNFTTSASAPLTGTFRGNDTSPLTSRTKTPPNNIFNCGLTAGENDPVPFSGTGVVNGSGSNIRPTGTFTIGLDTVAGTSSLSGTTLNLLGGSTATASSLIDNLTAAPFCANAALCNFTNGLTLDLPLGDATVTSVLAVQTGGTASGTLTPTGPGAWTYSIPAVFDVTPTVIFNGAPLSTGTQSVPAVVSGSITRSGNSVTVTSVVNFNSTQTVTDPVPVAETAIPSITGVFVCEGLNLLITSTITSSTLTLTSNAALASSGTLVCPYDVNSSGEVDLSDLLDFFDLWSTENGLTGPGLLTDFNNNGTTDLSDLLDFFDGWGINQPTC